MPLLTPTAAVQAARKLYEQREAERYVLDDVRRYWVGRQRLPAVLPTTVPAEVKQLATLARVNVIGLVVESLAQSLSVEGYRATREADNAEVWGIWQANKMDARQSIIHRSCLAYGISYAVVTPGTPQPVIRGLSPRKITTLYDEADADWPVMALERRSERLWRLYDAEAVYLLSSDSGATFSYQSTTEHSAGFCPVVRYLEIQDPDWDDEPTDESRLYTASEVRPRHVIGQVSPLMAIQDQIDVITFNMLVAQHYAAFRQRYIIGWLAPNEETRLKMAASTIWTFADKPDQVQVGDLDASPLTGYLDSRESSFRQVASLSQTPAHELIGELVNLSAEALAAAEAGRDRKVQDRQTTMGESHEQTLALAARMAGLTVPADAQVIWRDTAARAFAATVDALGKLATMLSVPVAELWERIPGISQQDVERWRAAARRSTVRAMPASPAEPEAEAGDQEAEAGAA